jgi:diaminobutyrate-2-oxoglutarate transaminase
LTREVEAKGRMIRTTLEKVRSRFPEMDLSIRGRGMIWGLDFGSHAELAGMVAHEAFNSGVIIETSGARDQVLKFLPPLVTPNNILRQGLEIVAQAAIDVLDRAESVAADSEHSSEQQEVTQ